jgi:hypothetical protein
MDKGRKRVLLLAPPYMDIYKDIITCLEQLDYEVTWVEDGQIAGNPYNLKNITRHTKPKDIYANEVLCFWQSKFTEWGDCKFDFFLAIDGLMVCNDFFEELSRRCPEIRKVLYLYDRIENNYELDCFFPYYDKVSTFDIADSQKYNIFHLPIYWVPVSAELKENFDIFAMASYDVDRRYKIFTRVKKIAKEEGLKENIHMWHPRINNRFLYQCKYLVKRILNEKMLSLRQLQDEIFTNQTLSPDEFRAAIFNSKVILDTHLPYQDGLTARFMWALGAGKKIITTNANSKNYAFYDSNQIMILNNNFEEIVDFIRKPFEMSNQNRNIVLKYRIDNWIKTLLSY